MRLSKRMVIALGFSLAGLLGVLLVGRLIAWGNCSWYGNQTDRDTRYASFIGCMVRVNDAWIPRNELRVVQ